jgi:hypothetical protein
VAIVLHRPAVDCHSVAGAEFLEQLPKKDRHPEDVRQTENGVVRRACEFESFSRPRPKHRVSPGVEERFRPYGFASATDKFEITVVRRVRGSIWNELIDPHRTL